MWFRGPLGCVDPLLYSGFCIQPVRFLNLIETFRKWFQLLLYTAWSYKKTWKSSMHGLKKTLVSANIMGLPLLSLLSFLIRVDCSNTAVFKRPGGCVISGTHACHNIMSVFASVALAPSLYLIYGLRVSDLFLCCSLFSFMTTPLFIVAIWCQFRSRVDICVHRTSTFWPLSYTHAYPYG